MRVEDGSVTDVLAQFQNDPRIPFAVLDRSGEEGLNLHYAHALVHADLPLSAERLEQRIGRLDRFGRRHPSLPQYVVLPIDDGGLWIAWLELLKKGFALFNASISDVQFVLGTLERDIELSMLHEGATGVRRLVDEVRRRLDGERQSLDEQTALDQASLLRESPERLVEELEGAEADEGAIECTFEKWLINALQFDRRGNQQDVFELEWSNRVLLPSAPWKEFFRPDLARPLTWRRRVAMHRQAVALLRPGAPLIEALTKQLRWDDRGTAFITWRLSRQVPAGSLWLFVKLCFVIKSAVPYRDAVLAPAAVDAMRRRATALLPPCTAILYLDSNLSEVTDSATIATLQGTYRTQVHDGRARDYNMADRPLALDMVVDSVQLAKICRAARDNGAELVRARPEFIRSIEEAVRLANELAERRRRRVELRRLLGLKEPDSGESKLDLRVQQAVECPEVRLDSIGIFMLASQLPPKVGTT